MVPKELTVIQLALGTSNNGTSNYPLVSKNIDWTNFLYYLHFISGYHKLLISQSKFPETRKFYFEISVVWNELRL